MTIFHSRCPSGRLPAASAGGAPVVSAEVGQHGRGGLVGRILRDEFAPEGTGQDTAFEVIEEGESTLCLGPRLTYRVKLRLDAGRTLSLLVERRAGHAERAQVCLVKSILGRSRDYPKCVLKPGRLQPPEYEFSIKNLRIDDGLH